MVFSSRSACEANFFSLIDELRCWAGVRGTIFYWGTVAIKIATVKQTAARYAWFRTLARIEAARSGLKARKTEQRIELRRGLADPLPDFAHRGQQHVDLDRLAGFDVLQHRGLECAELARDGVAILPALLDRTADSGADRRRLAHHVETEAIDQGIVEHAIDRCAGERRDRIHGHVAPQFVPDVALDAGGDLDIEGGAGKRFRHRARPRRVAAARLADDQAIADVVPRESRFRARA